VSRRRTAATPARSATEPTPSLTSSTSWRGLRSHHGGSAQAPAVGDTLETGLINVSLYQHFKLTGDFASGMTPVADKPLHFVASGQTWAPFFVADGQPGPSQPYHVYVRRHEPAIVFGGVDSGVANTKRDDGMTFLDVVWAGAPFANHGRFIAAVERTAAEWRAAGRVTETEQSAIAQAARRAERDLA
jgi:hypothetical protein